MTKKMLILTELELVKRYLREMYKEGLCDRDEAREAYYRINDAGRAALEKESV